MMQAQNFPLVSHSPKRWADFVRTRTPILESIIPLDSQGRRHWKAICDETLIAHAIWTMKEGGITGRKELSNANQRLYQALRVRKLFDQLEFDNKYRNWVGVEGEELVAFAKMFIKEKGITVRGELEEVDRGLYFALGNRKLLDGVGLDGKYRNWEGMEEEELVAFAKKFIQEKGISKRSKLKRVDSGLYQVLRERKLLEEVGLPDLNMEHRDWAGMEKAGIIAFAKRFIQKRGINGKWELRRADIGLYSALWRRELLDAVLSDIESSGHKEAVDGVLDALDSFGDDK